MKTDLNCDLGESFGSYTIGMDREVIPLVSSVNIACGFHASDPSVMHRTVDMAAEAGVGIGAHPGFPDLMGFGRRNMNVTPGEAADYITYQLGALYGFVKSRGAAIQHVKPHGALYNMSARDPKLAMAIALAVQRFDPELILLGLSGSESIKAAQTIGLPFAREVFADRAYADDGSLVPRSVPDSVITEGDEIARRVVRMVTEHRVTSIAGREVEIVPDSICLHGDNPHALELAARIRRELENAGCGIVPMKQIVKP